MAEKLILVKTSRILPFFLND